MHTLMLGYIDPGSGTLLVQALIASSVGSLIVFRDVIWGFVSRVIPTKASSETTPQVEVVESAPSETLTTR